MKQIKKILKSVYDPEIPVLSIIDLGILRNIIKKDNSIEVIITPTYSGCPATSTFKEDIIRELTKNGIKNITVTTQLSPAWTTDWLTKSGKEKLKNYGIAPPIEISKDKSSLFFEPPKVPCPLCNSMNTQLVSQFGSTACKALYKCSDCFENFEYFKCH